MTDDRSKTADTVVNLQLQQPEKSMAEIAREVGISRERVRQILVKTGLHTCKQIRSKAPKQERDWFVTIREGSRLLGLHPNTLRRWGDRGLLAAYRIGPRGDRRFSYKEIVEFLYRED
jgi:excisionase family DNA binding protein